MVMDIAELERRAGGKVSGCYTLIFDFDWKKFIMGKYHKIDFLYFYDICE